MDGTLTSSRQFSKAYKRDFVFLAGNPCTTEREVGKINRILPWATCGKDGLVSVEQILSASVGASDC